MKRYIKYLFFSFSLLFFLDISFCQSVQTNAVLDTNTILIGDFLKVKIDISNSSSLQLIIPKIDKTLFPEYSKIEFISDSSYTTISENGISTYSQIITITSYDEGEYSFPSIPVLNSDSILIAQTDTLPFTVKTIPVDTTAAFKDIKPIFSVPLTFREIIPYLLVTLLGLMIIVGIILLIANKVKSKKVKPVAYIPKQKEKADIIAFRELEILKQQNLWQQGKVKLYYSKLTEIIRIYLKNRFEIDAMEMVSEEIMSSVKLQITKQEAINNLKELLEKSDLVKFAKWVPLPDDHNRCFKYAIAFVELTKQNDIEKESSNKSIDINFNILPLLLFVFFTNFINILKDLFFKNPYYLFLLLLIIPIAGWQIWKYKKIQTSINISSISPFQKIKKSWRSRFFWITWLFEIIALVLLVIALARPQSSFRHKNVQVEGVDIVLSLDISGSMKAMDFKPSRLGVTKKVASEFIESRPADRIGLVVYAGEAYTQCPVTTDHKTLLGLLDKVKFDIIDDGTAIGDGLGTAINRLRDSDAKTKLIILLSDGVNNTGYMDPLSAAEIAKDLGIKVYTIGCGSTGKVPFPGPLGTVFIDSEIDEPLLAKIAITTGGKYFRANNSDKLKQVYEQIDKMEKTIINETVFENKADEFAPFLILALISFFLFVCSKYFIFKIKP